MDKTMKKYLEDFIKICYSRLEKGEISQKDAYKKTDLHDQIIEELADVANYAFLEYMKMKNLKIAKSRLLKKSKKKAAKSKTRKKKR